VITLFKYIVFALAITFLLGHSLIPHDHKKCGKMESFNKRIPPSSVFHLFQSALAGDLGTDHLKKFSKRERQLVSVHLNHKRDIFAYLYIPKNEEIVLTSLIAFSFLEKTLITRTDFFISPINWRGPPTI
jgi:hypothetical protein